MLKIKPIMPRTALLKSLVTMRKYYGIVESEVIDIMNLSNMGMGVFVWLWFYVSLPFVYSRDGRGDLVNSQFTILSICTTHNSHVLVLHD